MGRSMPATGNDLTDNEPPVELSEADRAEWLRIERALRGMRWWMLFLALPAGAVAVMMVLAAASDLIGGELEDDRERPYFATFMSLVIALGISLGPVSILLVRGFFAITSCLPRRDNNSLYLLARTQLNTWIAAAVSAFCASASMAICAILVLYVRFYVR